MRIAFVSHEFAGSASGGGIGTYVRGAAAMMAARGHEVEVFTASSAESHELPAGVLVHVTPAERARFSDAVASAFAQRHSVRPFDVVEGPDFGADAAVVARCFPDLPLVVRLHTPTFLIDEIRHSYLSNWQKARFILGGLRRGRFPRPYWRYDSSSDPERVHALAASEITAPSLAILELVRSRWNLDRNRLTHSPNVFNPNASLLTLPISTTTSRVTYLGRLEARKGVLELARAIGIVLRRRGDTRFRLIGRSLPHPTTGEDMASHIRRVLGPCSDAVEIVDAHPHNEVPRLLGESDICVFPSVWENMPYACLEAMAAGRGVIASGRSGTAEIIENGQTGILVQPRDARSLADAILEMVFHPARAAAMGRKAREYVRTAYTSDVVGPLQEESYLRAIKRGNPQSGARASR